MENEQVDYKDIFVAYKKSWSNLVDFFEKKNAENSDDKDKYEYEKSITEAIRPVLFSFVYNVADKAGFKFKIGRAIIQVNSLYKKRRIRIPVNGQDIKHETKFNDWEREDGEQKRWSDSFFDPEKNKENGRELMYLQPDKPVHLLTELMWRFNNKDNGDVGCFIALKPNANEFLHKIKDNNYFKKIILKENTFVKGDSEIDTEIGTQLRDLVKFPKVRLPYGEYTADDCKVILKTPFDIFYGDNKLYTYERPKNIIYISDIIETDYLGAFDFELVIDETIDKELEGKLKETTEEELEEFISKLRFYFSKFIVELLSNFERNYASSEPIYRNLYFELFNKNNNPCLKKFIEYLTPEDEIRCFEIKEVLFKIKSHFTMADSNIGLYWRGYKRHAYEVACTVAGVIDILFAITKKNGERLCIESIIRSQGVGLEKLSSILKKEDVPYIFIQLFRGLEREKELFLLPKYREHFIHSFYCFSFGLILLNKRKDIPTIVPDNLNIYSESDDGKDCDNLKSLIQQWFITAMWHDIAYTLEKGNEIIEKYVLNFMDDPKRYRNVLPWVPHVGSLLQIDNLLDELKFLSKENTITLNKKIMLKKDKNIEAKDIVLAVAFDNVNHGIWSSLFAHHALFNHYKDKNNSIDQKKEFINQICRAILPHHLANWDVDKILKDFELLGKKPKWINIARINIKNNRLGYLLSLCDIFCQAGREYLEYTEDKEKASDMQIRFSDMEIEKNKFSITISYKNDDSNGMTKDKLKDIIKNYYTKPLKYLNMKDLSSSSTTNATLIVNVVSKNTVKDHGYYDKV